MNDELLTMVEREVLGWPGVTSEPGGFGATPRSIFWWMPISRLASMFLTRS